MPILCVRERKLAHSTQRIVASTIGAAVDLRCQDLRRAFVDACYWALRLADRIPDTSNVDLVGKYASSPFGFGKARCGLHPELMRYQPWRGPFSMAYR